jgi:hypothetical protein
MQVWHLVSKPKETANLADTWEKSAEDDMCVLKGIKLGERLRR